MTRRRQPRLWRRKPNILAALGTWLLCILPAHAGDKTVLNSAPSETAPTRLVPDWSFDVNGDYVVGSRFRALDSLGSQAASYYEVEALRRFRLADNWYFRVGFDLARFDFSRSNAIFPSSLNTVAGEVALEYWRGEDIGILVKLSPGLYFTRDHLTKNAFDIPVEVGSGIQITKHFSLALGVTTGLLREWPVLPVGGFVWDVNDRLKVSAVFPEPRVTYKFSPEFQVFVDGELAGGGYRNGPTDDRRTNNAALTYSEVRGGVGLAYAPRKGLSFEGSAGWTLRREIDYFRSGPEFSTRAGAPYFKLDVSWDLF